MSEALIAYFSMEIALHPAMPADSGDLASRSKVARSICALGDTTSAA